jgi:uncharacterized protein YecE (DUF72 family)
MVACEGRHPSWFGDDATALLRERGIARVMADPPAGQPGAHVPTSEAAYLRLHGTPRVYYSSYPPEFLERLARYMAAQTAAGRDVWCIFDNTAGGEAVPNALELMRARPGFDPTEGEIPAPW